MILTNIKSIRLDIYCSSIHQKEFRNEQVYEFLWRSNNLLPIDANMLEKYVWNYDPKYSSSVAFGQIVGIYAIVL